jgi:uncharacterized membrane protein YeaQ/YmgE (transglycosylase-associated protein family)
MNNLPELLLVGIIAGLIIGLFPSRRGATRLVNTLVGIVGAILGAWIYKIAHLPSLGLPKYEMTLALDNVVIALVGAGLFLLITSYIKRQS